MNDIVDNLHALGFRASREQIHALLAQLTASHATPQPAPAGSTCARRVGVGWAQGEALLIARRGRGCEHARLGRGRRPTCATCCASSPTGPGTASSSSLPPLEADPRAGRNSAEAGRQRLPSGPSLAAVLNRPSRVRTYRGRLRLSGTGLTERLPFTNLWPNSTLFLLKSAMRSSVGYIRMWPSRSRQKERSVTVRSWRSSRHSRPYDIYETKRSGRSDPARILDGRWAYAWELLLEFCWKPQPVVLHVGGGNVAQIKSERATRRSC
jgi:hypothetical protein